MDRDELDGDQLVAIAAILASGVVRRLQHRRRAGTPNLSDSLAAGLEVSPDTVLSVTNPVNGPESPKPGAQA